MPAGNFFFANVSWIQMLIGILVGVSATLLGVALSRIWLPSKVLAWHIIADEHMVKTRMEDIEQSDDLQVLWRGIVVQDPRLITVRLFNDGRREIAEADFAHRSIDLKVDNGTFVSTPAVLGAQNDSLRADAQIWHSASSMGEVTPLKPILFNRGDWVDLSLFVDGGEDVTLSTRFAGQTRNLQETDPNVRKQKRSTMAKRSFAIALALMTITLFVYSVAHGPKLPPERAISNPFDYPAPPKTGATSFHLIDTVAYGPPSFHLQSSIHSSDGKAPIGPELSPSAVVSLKCFAFGDAVGSPPTKLWYRVSVEDPSSSGKATLGYISDFYLLTGRGDPYPGIPKCTS